MDIKNLVERLSSIRVGKFATRSHFDTIESKLITYEHEYHQLKDATCMLELALWKSKIDESMQTSNLEPEVVAVVRGQCRINCGADVIIPNVLLFLQ